MATPGIHPEEARPPEAVITGRKFAESERTAAAVGISAESDSDVPEIHRWTSNNNNPENCANYVDVNANIDSANNNNNNNNKVPDLSDFNNKINTDEIKLLPKSSRYKETLKYVFFPKRPISAPVFRKLPSASSANDESGAVIDNLIDGVGQISKDESDWGKTNELLILRPLSGFDRKEETFRKYTNGIERDLGGNTSAACAGKVNKIKESVGDKRGKIKNRNSYHCDVEEALSSLLWQPYEYQNVYQNADSSPSSSSISSSSCSSIRSSSSDLERRPANNGLPIQSSRSGNAADLHLSSEMVNNLASYENLLGQCEEGNDVSRDCTGLSNASRLMVGISPKECVVVRAAATCSCDAYCDEFFSGDMRVEVPSVPDAIADGSLNANNAPPINLTQHHINNNQPMMMQQRAQQIPSDNGYQRSISTSSLSSANVVGLPNHPRHASVPCTSSTNRNLAAGSNNVAFPNANHPRNSSEPVNMVQFKYNGPSNSVNCANIVSILNHQRHSSQVDSTNAHVVNHLRSASVPKTQKTCETATLNVVQQQHQRNSSDVNVNRTNDQTRQQQQQQPPQRLPLNVSNVNVNYYRAVPVNVVSAVPTIQCVNECSNNNVSNVNIVQAMPVGTSNSQHPYSHFHPQCNNNTYANVTTTCNTNSIQLPTNIYTPSTTSNMYQYPQQVQQCAITTFGNSIITQHFPSGTTYSINTPQPICSSMPYTNPIQISNSNTQNTAGTQVVVQNCQNQVVVPPPPPPTHTISTADVIVHSSHNQNQVQVRTTQPEVRTRTFTSTEAQTDDTAVGTAPTTNEASTSAAVNNREQRRRERRERRHHRRVSTTNHRHSTNEHGIQWNGQQNDRLPDILNSHMPPPYASVGNGGPPPPPPQIIPNTIVSSPMVPPPGAVVQTMVPNSIVPSGIVGSPMVPFPPPVVPGQVPLVQGAAPIPVPVPAPTGFRFPFPAGGFRRTRYSEEPPKSCCGLLAWKPGSLRWFIALIAVVAVCCVLVGTVLGAMRSSGRDHLTVSLLMIGVGIVLVTVSGVAWRLTSHDSPTCRSMLGLGSTESVDVCTRRFVPRLPPSYGRPHHPYAAMMYPEFQYRPPPPSYQASMQEYRLRLLLLDRGNTPQIQAGLQNAVSPPPTYRSHAGSLLRAPLSSRRDASQSEYSCPPSYRSQTSSTRPGNTIQAPSILHSREQSLSLSESNHDGSVNVVSILNNNDEDIALDNITLDSLKMEPESELNPLKMLLKGSTSDLEGSKDGNLVTIVQTSDQSPVIVTVSGSSNADSSRNVQISEVQSEMQILAHL